MKLRVALVGGPMYDRLYDVLDRSAVEVVIHADHPTLNRAAAELLSRGERIDLLCTHSKYAPSQAAWLTPLDEFVSPARMDDLAPAAVGLCRFRGALLCLPRNIDVRVMWVRRDRGAAPATWADLLAGHLTFGFPGRESGLFGMFYELVRDYGGHLFDSENRPTMQSAEAEAAVQTLVELAQRAPADLVEWHYDEVDAALIEGRVDAAATWPGGFAGVRRSPHYRNLDVHPYPGGPLGRYSYSGCHAFAIPTTCGDLPAAIELLHVVTSPNSARHDSGSGSVPASMTAFAAVEPLDYTDARRLRITRDTIATAMITYPSLTNFPEIENAGWAAINAALGGMLTPHRCVEKLQAAAQAALGM
ncbi:MAG: extracellular solute-binding protein [Ilumatobacteraceae bacterium]